MNNLSLRLKQLRLENNLFQKDIANLLGKSIDSISLYEKGKNEPCNNDIVKLATFFNVSTDYLLGLEDDFGIKTYEKQDHVILEKKQPLNETEQRLLLYFRVLSLFEQGELIGVARTMAKKRDDSIE